MRVLNGAQKHVNCFDQGFKCFTRHLAWGLQPFVFPEFKARFDCCCFTSYMYSLFTCLACTHHLHVGGDVGGFAQ